MRRSNMGAFIQFVWIVVVVGFVLSAVVKGMSSPWGVVMLAALIALIAILVMAEKK